MSVRKEKQQQFSDQELMNGLWDNDMEVLDVIYAQYLAKVRSMVKNNSGSASDASDVFQDALVVFFKKKSDPDFKLTSSFGAYLISVARFVWLRKLRKKSRETEVTPALSEVSLEGEDIETTLIQSEKRILFQEKLAQLGADCQRVLKLFFAGTPLKEIAKQMGYTDDYIKKKNRVCKQKLTEEVKKDPRYKELSN